MTVQVIDGEVVIIGPDGVALSVTAEAALLSGRRLIAAAEQVERRRPVPGAREEEP